MSEPNDTIRVSRADLSELLDKIAREESDYDGRQEALADLIAATPQYDEHDLAEYCCHGDSCVHGLAPGNKKPQEPQRRLTADDVAKAVNGSDKELALAIKIAEAESAPEVKE